MDQRVAVERSRILARQNISRQFSDRRRVGWSNSCRRGSFSRFRISSGRVEVLRPEHPIAVEVEPFQSNARILNLLGREAGVSILVEYADDRLSAKRCGPSAAHLRFAQIAVAIDVESIQLRRRVRDLVLRELLVGVRVERPQDDCRFLSFLGILLCETKRRQSQRKCEEDTICHARS